ncbi:formiminotransferase N-terminal subdomain-containing protein isoform X2 [Neolamprologus brichardi]|uniref:formiminotransferase N-terminal subdomain-containing protein isoform X2 n=1 Tax=Neolamprologus brichardi TaxID=32507 RepID=UPI0016439ADB|nr:formiminotransferase N-terminal subdomain-containing protein isoform X2 [Neolamprologus brichardi]
MASSSLGRRLVACLLNVSEARRKDLVETVAQAALYNTEGVRREGTTVLNIFNDYDYNRSVITIVSSIDLIGEAILCACEKACGLIDMQTHTGVHPCMGAVDLIPIYPLGEELWLRDLQRGSGAPAPSCLAGQTSPYSEDWRTGGRRWAGSRRRRTCGRSGPTWGRSHRNDWASQVSGPVPTS